eukprot:9259010-Heterocapsa_arctica.AAC.1
MYDSLLKPDARRSGAVDPQSPQGEPDALLMMATALRDQGTDFAAMARMQVDEKKFTRGTPRALGRDEEDLVFLARACDQYRVH